MTHPSVQVVGGMASAGTGPGANRLVIDGRVADRGAVGVLLPPSSSVRAVVSQGCAPIGDPYTVTRAEGSMVHEIAGRPALERVREVVDGLSAADRAKAAAGLHVGRVVDEHRVDFERGDFLVRNVLGADPSTGAVAIGDQIDVGDTIQFQVRDAVSADADLRLLLDDRSASGALVFTCNGRGARFFAEPHHDAMVISEALGTTCDRRHVLRRRDRPGRCPELRPRVHGERGAVPLTGADDGTATHPAARPEPEAGPLVCAPSAEEDP